MACYIVKKAMFMVELVFVFPKIADMEVYAAVTQGEMFPCISNVEDVEFQIYLFN